MNESTLGKIVKEYKDIKKIVEGDFSEIEELEKDPIIQRYNYLMMLKDKRFDFETDRAIEGHLLSEYCQGYIEETNGIWCLVYEMSVQKYEDGFNTTLNEYDKDDMVLVYFDLENNQRHTVISKEEQETFESSHDVIYGKPSITDGCDRYYNVRRAFLDLCLKEGQDVAVKKVLTMYSNIQDEK